MTGEGKWPKVEDQKGEIMSVKVKVGAQKSKMIEREKRREVTGNDGEKRKKQI